MRSSGAGGTDAASATLLFWLVVALELGTFTIIFAALAWLRGSEPVAFAAFRRTLDLDGGLRLTLLLVTSGAAAAAAVHAARSGDRRRVRPALVLAALLGVVFAVLKVVDLARHSRDSGGLGGGLFDQAYLLTTGFHLLHVLVGIVLLSVAAVRYREPAAGDENAIAGPALFWHMCDLIWFFLFPLCYAP